MDKPTPRECWNLMSREQKVGTIRRFRKARPKETLKVLAILLGIKEATLHHLLNDPDGNKLKMRRIRGNRCSDCGAEIYGPSIRCRSCRSKFQYANRQWTRETVIAAAQRWAEEHDGQPPVAGDWLNAREYWPSFASVYGPRRAFKSWADFIEAAGFERPLSGRRRSYAGTRKRVAPGDAPKLAWGELAGKVNPNRKWKKQ